jgi:hypothetical protein
MVGFIHNGLKQLDNAKPRRRHMVQCTTAGWRSSRLRPKASSFCLVFSHDASFWRRHTPRLQAIGG